jgi:hypothetical protein
MSMDVFLYLLVLHHCGTVPLLLIHGCPVPEDKKGIPTGENVKKGIYIYVCVCEREERLTAAVKPPCAYFVELRSMNSGLKCWMGPPTSGDLAGVHLEHTTPSPTPKPNR